MNNSIHNLPLKRKALEVVMRKDGGYAPSLNNLGANSQYYSDTINAQLLKNRRQAICPYDQFPTESDLRNYDKGKLKIKNESDPSYLRDNLYLAMNEKSVNISKGFGGNAAHHIVEGTDPAAKQSRTILERFGININAPENGILLPTDNIESIYKGCIHNTSHTEEYSLYVYDKIKEGNSKEELIHKLWEIKNELYSGKLDLQGPKQIANKNIR